LQHSTNRDREKKLFFWQIEALETLIYLTEAAKKVGDNWVENWLRDGSSRDTIPNSDKLSMVSQELGTIFFSTAGEQTPDDISLFRRSLALRRIIIPARAANADLPLRSGGVPRQQGAVRSGDPVHWLSA